ncbi:MAG: class I SAM-dependent methyltransferase [Okeania sp. SIO3B5]|nr:class I SAM-dependent methyltransferase [Okeania sp. SIO3B5]
MHPRVYQEFEKICSEKNINGSVLEIGAIPSSNSLLCMKSLEKATEKVGLDLKGPQKFKDFKIHQGNANSMDIFQDEKFDVVLCNAVLEHDKYFWKTISEINRVTKPGGLIVLGTPGYKYFKIDNTKSLLTKAVMKVPSIRSLRLYKYLHPFLTVTVTHQVHDAPGDYYRFSPQTFKEVFFAEMDNVEVRSVLLPPIVIGVGHKRHSLKATE